MSSDVATVASQPIDWKKHLFLILGVLIFVLIYYSPPWPEAIDPNGKVFSLSPEGKGAIAVFLLAACWWVFEVVPIGVTSLAIGVLQVLFFIRPANKAFTDFMDPNVLFIYGSLMIGMVFTKTGLTRRIAYKMLAIVGERTSMILLGVFVLTTALTHIMAHTGAAATIYPLLVAIYALYGEGDKPTKFGKALFIGMAYVAGAGSIITLLGAARGAVAIGFFNEIKGKSIGFFELTYYMAPVGWMMTLLLWGYFMVVLKPEKKTIPGLRERAKRLNAELGRITKKEILAASIVAAAILVLGVSAVLKSFVPEFSTPNKTAVILISTILFFVTGIFDTSDLQEIPWNIILLFAGAMSIGYCLWQTGAAEWMAINYLSFFKNAHWFIFVLSIAFLVMVMTNFIMNVAAIAIVLPVALVTTDYMGVAGEIILFSSLVAAGMPFMLLVGAAPNAIAYDSRQFTIGEFFLYGVPASILLIVVIGVAVRFIWPLMGMPLFAG
jgi:sodium-dependent dicarboxylate transporter 2/3/5